MASTPATRLALLLSRSSIGNSIMRVPESHWKACASGAHSGNLGPRRLQQNLGCVTGKKTSECVLQDIIPCPCLVRWTAAGAMSVYGPMLSKALSRFALHLHEHKQSEIVQGRPRTTGTPLPWCAGTPNASPCLLGLHLVILETQGNQVRPNLAKDMDTDRSGVFGSCEDLLCRWGCLYHRGLRFGVPLCFILRVLSSEIVVWLVILVNTSDVVVHPGS